MRTALLLAATCATIASQATIFDFDLGPQVVAPDTSNPPNTKLFGLNGGNEVPPTGSPATGNEDPVGGNITYDDVTKQLNIGVGWGSHPDVGGTDLTGPATAAHIHGPASIGQEVPPLYDITSNISPAGTSSETGFIDTRFTLIEGQGGFTIAEQEQQLFGGLWYLNIHTAAFSDGEIRGQLIPVPEPQYYALMAGFGLIGFAGYRRFKVARA